MLELLTGMVVATAALALVLEPLVRRVSAPLPAIPDDEPIDLGESQSPKDRALLALREIEFDRATGKLSDEDFAQLKEQYSRAALDAMAAEATRAAEPAVGEAEVDAAIQRMRKRRRDCPACGIRPEPSAAFCSRCGRSLTEPNAPPRCWMCGAALEPDARFCSRCGSQVEDVQPPPAPLRNAG